MKIPRYGAFLVVLSALTLSQGAWALTHFRCGVNRVPGKLYLSGVTNKDKSKIDMSIQRAPLLVIWEGTLSETVIPLRVSDGLRERLAGTGMDPLPGNFDVEIFQASTKPDVAELQDFHRRDAAQIEGTATAQARLIKPESCHALPAIPEPKGGAK